MSAVRSHYLNMTRFSDILVSLLLAYDIIKSSRQYEPLTIKCYVVVEVIFEQ